jgi:hypothetical protein
MPATHSLGTGCASYVGTFPSVLIKVDLLQEKRVEFGLVGGSEYRA